jgi:hypothetical protein
MLPDGTFREDDFAPRKASKSAWLFAMGAEVSTSSRPNTQTLNSRASWGNSIPAFASGAARCRRRVLKKRSSGTKSVRADAPFVTLLVTRGLKPRRRSKNK